MKLNWVVQFGIHAALAFAAAVIDNTKATDAQKAAAQKLILAGDEFISSFSA